MSETAFTPGPWFAVPHPDTSCEAIGIVDGATRDATAEWDTDGGFSGAHTTCYLNAEANAALIAASPELLEALQKLLAYNEDIIAGRINYRPEDHAQVARAAISRATQAEGK